jgi:hypothetical protein
VASRFQLCIELAFVFITGDDVAAVRAPGDVFSGVLLELVG